MSCYECGSPDGTIALLCPHCIERKKARQLQRNSENSTLAYSSEPQGVSLWAELLKIGLFVRVLIVAVVLGSILLAARITRPNKIENFPLPSTYSAENPCLYKARCVVAFFAPWCPHCQDSIGFLKDFRQRVPLLTQNVVGVRVIVGMDEPDNIRAMARDIGGQVFLDMDHKFEHAARVRGVPAWFVLDSEGNIVNRGSGFGVSGLTPEENVRYFMKENLEIGNFLSSSKN